MRQPPKPYTSEEIKRIAPGYRNKPENFNPDKVEKKTPAPKPKNVVKPNRKKVPPQTKLEAANTPTPQKNIPMWANSVFGVDVSVRVTSQPRTHSNARTFGKCD